MEENISVHAATAALLVELGMRKSLVGLVSPREGVLSGNPRPSASPVLVCVPVVHCTNRRVGLSFHFLSVLDIFFTHLFPHFFIEKLIVGHRL